jgi:hypothetical protein
MARGRFPPIFTPNTLELMIEYTLISSVVNRICEMTTKPCEYPRDDTHLPHLQHLLGFRTWGITWKKTIDKIDEWVTWRWANAKIDKKKSYIIETKYKHSKGGYGRLPLANFYTCHGFF